MSGIFPARNTDQRPYGTKLGNKRRSRDRWDFCIPHMPAAPSLRWSGHGLTPSSFSICQPLIAIASPLFRTLPGRRDDVPGSPGLPGPRVPDRQLLATFLDLLTLAVLLPFLAQRLLIRISGNYWDRSVFYLRPR
jgi:hypothetical protein